MNLLGVAAGPQRTQSHTYTHNVLHWLTGEKLSNYKGPTAIMDFVGKVNNKARVTKDYAAVVESIKKSYPSVTKIGQQGFCWWVAACFVFHVYACVRACVCL